MSEVQLTKNFLQKEIEARRSQKTSLAQQRFAPCPEHPEEQPKLKLFIVSSRLPYTIILNEETGEHEHETDPFDVNIAELLASVPFGRTRSGGLRNTCAVLVGTPLVRRKSDKSIVQVTNLSEAVQGELDAYLRSQLNVVPVFPPPNRDRFADWMIFPLFHYSLPSAETGLRDHDWEGYELVNEMFRSAVLKEYSRGDLVWINDYQLMLLPKLLRKERPDIPIGFYLHCVFPSSEVYRILPQRENILRGVLSSNIVGFHNFEYAQQFLNSCIHILGLECSASSIEACEDAGGTTTKVVTVPLGIHIEPYQHVLNLPDMPNRLQHLQHIFATKKLLVAVDRLEEKKGIPHKIMAFHKLLQRDPSWATRCVFVQIVETAGNSAEEASGDDTNSSDPGELLQQVYQMVGEVNSKFGTIGHLPVHFLSQEFNRSDLVALLVQADVMIDTPLRDVLSQSAHEFLCCQEDSECGVLILSEFSGSAQSLRAAALTVNPWDTNAFADAIEEALEMELHDRVELHRYGRKYVHDYTLKHWASNFLDELETAERECETERLQIPPQLDHDGPLSAMRKASRRLFIFGFSGTLVPHKSRLITKILPKLPSVLVSNLQVIAEDPNTHVVVISGLARDTLAQTLGPVPCWIIGEGGLCYRAPDSADWHSFVEQRDTEWLGPVKDIMKYFTARTPGSNVIEMNSSVSWLYQNTQGDHAAIQSKDLLVHLWAGPLLSAPAEVVVEKDSVTVRPTGTGKAVQLDKLLQQICPEPNKWLGRDTLVLCIGDFLMRDEDIFATVQKFFECNGASERKTSSYTCASEVGDLWCEGKSLMDREPHRSEAMNFEANSMSLGSGFDLAATRLAQLDPADGPFGLRAADSLLEGGPPMLKKTPSEPDLQAAGEHDSQADRHAGCLDADAHDAPAIFTCTVNRKATRAAYHLSDTNDVAFLVAKLAREVRQAKQVNEGNGADAPARSADASVRKSSGYQGLASLFERP